MLEGSSPEERVTFEKWLEDNRKVRSIILAFMINKIQKQYDRLDDVPSIMLHMKKSHGVKMLSLVEKLEDLKAGFDNDTYIDVILQSLPPSYDPFIINYNINGLEKSIHELINMLVQYEATTHKSAPAVLVGEVSTFKAKGKRVGRRKRKKGKGKIVMATASAEGAPAAPTGKGKGKGKVGRFQRSKANDVCMHCQEKGHWKREYPQLLSNPGAGKKQKAEIRKLVDSKSLEIDDLDNLQTCESCLKGKITKKPFVGQSAISNSLLDLIHIDVCEPLNNPARGGYSYFITFTDDHSRYGYVYLMRYKSETSRRISLILMGYILEMAVKLLNMAPSKMVPQMLYGVWHDKPASYKYLGVWEALHMSRG
ncbi:UNVERIFIED_CONTAM: hypothetical protein Scaly_2929500 [Sesamum calycinum]|uniref:Gag/pol protein n=1 Tax=Sesamum calycinum TaxID=2727403 RepID=A0AAW2KTR3_9LAMI